MDPLTVGLVLFNALAFTEKFYCGLQVVRRGQDPTSDDLYIRLIVEKARYAEWKKRMGIDTIEDAKKLMGKLTPETRVSLTEILTPMQRYTEKTDKMFARYNIHSLTPPTPLTPKQLLQRVDFAIDGQRRLNELLNVLKSCNDGLVQIVPPAPAYHDPRSDQILSSSDLPTHAQYSRIPTQSMSPLPSPAIDPDHTQSPSHSTRGELETQPILHLIHS